MSHSPSHTMPWNDRSSRGSSSSSSRRRRQISFPDEDSTVADDSRSYYSAGTATTGSSGSSHSYDSRGESVEGDDYSRYSRYSQDNHADDRYRRSGRGGNDYRQSRRSDGDGSRQRGSAYREDRRFENGYDDDVTVDDSTVDTYRQLARDYIDNDDASYYSEERRSPSSRGRSNNNNSGSRGRSRGKGRKSIVDLAMDFLFEWPMLLLRKLLFLDVVNKNPALGQVWCLIKGLITGAECTCHYAHLNSNFHYSGHENETHSHIDDYDNRANDNRGDDDRDDENDVYCELRVPSRDDCHSVVSIISASTCSASTCESSVALSHPPTTHPIPPQNARRHSHVQDLRGSGSTNSAPELGSSANVAMPPMASAPAPKYTQDQRAARSRSRQRPPLGRASAFELQQRDGDPRRTQSSASLDRSASLDHMTVEEYHYQQQQQPYIQQQYSPQQYSPQPMGNASWSRPPSRSGSRSSSSEANNSRQCFIVDEILETPRTRVRRDINRMSPFLSA